METLVQIKGTRREIGKLTPDIFRAAVGLEHHYQTVSLPHDGEVKSLAATLLWLLEQEQEHSGDSGQTGSKVPEERDGDGEAQQALRMDWASCYVPDHDKDAHFGHAGVVRVADGVGR
ncbi:hypothetical protein E2562_005735 [Oryza meyeriana var. granulata]|uniref:Uncharacterized protein n=1 Tax=Oryza meyeriana var. granulata TaxID=110450 RepID=A0A6G1F4A8_9ORYZ|nr:hypothetical protein E2562_005735 [Oryza meyeriana var. granulata]